MTGHAALRLVHAGILGGLSLLSPNPGEAGSRPPRSGSAHRGETDLSPLIRTQYLPRLAATHGQALGVESAELLRRLESEGPLQLHARRRRYEVSVVGSDESHEISPVLGAALVHSQQFIDLASTTLASPIQPEELEEALRSRHTVRRLRALFTRVMEQPLAIGGATTFLETGGEATLVDRGLALVEIPDPTRPATWALAEAGHDVAALRRVFLESPEAMSLLDEHGLLSATLDRLEVWEAKGVPEKKRLGILRQALDGTLQDAANTWTLTPEDQLATITSHQWQGRYVGRWHLHPPLLRDGSWEGGAPPSPDDVFNAVTDGQYLTIAFEPDGFTAYDLAGVRQGGREAIRSIRYRSESWHGHFAALAKSLHQGDAPTPQTGATPRRPTRP